MNFSAELLPHSKGNNKDACGFAIFLHKSNFHPFCCPFSGTRWMLQRFFIWPKAASPTPNLVRSPRSNYQRSSSTWLEERGRGVNLKKDPQPWSCTEVLSHWYNPVPNWNFQSCGGFWRPAVLLESAHSRITSRPLKFPWTTPSPTTRLICDPVTDIVFIWFLKTFYVLKVIVVAAVETLDKGQKGLFWKAHLKHHKFVLLSSAFSQLIFPIISIRLFFLRFCWCFFCWCFFAGAVSSCSWFPS